ncbi:DM13 domain-containing protein [Streptomyces sp. enrichment culture]|uniref:DM13 domain-containing protein n=1 Tax=Streptomyces sp. enrichment culture TaxID=1795815 RepID=UPI003F564B7D
MSRRVVVPAALVTAVAVAIGLYLFQPWKAFTDTRVDEALPTVVVDQGDKEATGTARPPARKKTAAPVDLAQGTFVTHEHDTSGTARTVRLADGGQLLRIEDLDTSDGPDVRVYLSTRDADEVESGLGDGAVQLGKLKGNLGNQNYTVPAGTDLSEFRSAVLWCKRFSVSFGAADLTPVAS